uniref:TIL domain-containing protein n=1 Tax=Ascaris lumbricoides TaxID=6252 RepID=A0A9J2Q7D9_ASCLU
MIASIRVPPIRYYIAAACVFLSNPFMSMTAPSATVLSATVIFCLVIPYMTAFSIRELIKGGKRTSDATPARSKVQPIGETKRQTDTYTEAQMRFRRAISVGCPTWHPFQCPNGDCVPIKYLCDVGCPTWHPFQCPNGDCVPIKYLCDGSPDCGDEYDENKSMCTAG